MGGVLSRTYYTEREQFLFHVLNALNIRRSFEVDTDGGAVRAFYGRVPQDSLLHTSIHVHI